MWRLLQMALLFTVVLSRKYYGHKVYRLYPQDEHHVQLFAQIVDSDPEIDYYSEPISALHQKVDIMVSPANIKSFTAKMADLSIPYYLRQEDVQKTIDKNMEANQARKDAAPFYDFTYYMDFDEMTQWLADKVAACGERCNMFSIGTSYEGHDLPVIRIEGTGANRQEKEDVWIDAGIHAREWLAHSTGNYFVERLVDDYGTDPFVTTFLDKYNVYVMPDVNPDGYVYSWTTDRLWRKTRQPSSETCYGADGNRNFNFQWNTVGTNPDPCSNIYPGANPWSEPETYAIGQFIQNITDADFLVYLTLHTYGLMWQLPYAYTCDRIPDYEELMRVGERATAALYAVHGTEFGVGSSCEISYPRSGTSRDWARGVMNIKYAYTLELRDGENFEVPPEEILPTGEETWAGFVEMMVAIEEADSSIE